MPHLFEREKPLVSIAIPSWFEDGQHGRWGENETYWFAQECLKRLLRITDRRKYELILIDNGSKLTQKNLPDDWIQINDYWQPADTLIRNSCNLGFGPAVNQAFALARGKYFVCLNNDILLFEGWLEEVIKPFSIDLRPKAGIVMPALVQGIRDPREALKLEDKQDFIKNAGSYGAGAEFGSLWVGEMDFLKQIAALRDGRQMFDEDFLMGMGEDRLLWQEVRKLGRETYRTHDTRVYHQGNMTITKVENRKNYTLPNREKLAKKKQELWGDINKEQKI